MDDVQPIIIWRPSAAREPGFRWVYRFYESRIGPPHVELDGSRRLFNKAALINRAGARFPGKILLMCDADCFPCDRQLFEGINLVREDSSRMCLPHDALCRMTTAESRRTLQTAPENEVTGEGLPRHRKHLAHGGLWILHQSLLSRHPVDTKFCGWGYEDVDFLKRVPHVRLPGGLFHIFHPRASMGRKKANLRRLRRKDRLRNKQSESNPRGEK